MLDSKGVITSDRENLTEQKRYFAIVLETVYKTADTYAQSVEECSEMVGGITR